MANRLFDITRLTNDASLVASLSVFVKLNRILSLTLMMTTFALAILFPLLDLIYSGEPSINCGFAQDLGLALIIFVFALIVRGLILGPIGLPILVLHFLILGPKGLKLTLLYYKDYYIVDQDILPQEL